MGGDHVVIVCVLGVQRLDHHPGVAVLVVLVAPDVVDVVVIVAVHAQIHQIVVVVIVVAVVVAVIFVLVVAVVAVVGLGGGADAVGELETRLAAELVPALEDIGELRIAPSRCRRPVHRCSRPPPCSPTPRP